MDLSGCSNEELFAELEKRLQEPVRPLGDFCTAVSTWFRCIVEMSKSGNYKDGWAQGKDYAEHLMHIEIDIRKSNLLYRLLYLREPLRTRRCPIHDGHWDGQAMLRGCEHGCDGTGWLREVAK